MYIMSNFLRGVPINYDSESPAQTGTPSVSFSQVTPNPSAHATPHLTLGGSSSSSGPPEPFRALRTPVLRAPVLQPPEALLGLRSVSKTSSGPPTSGELDNPIFFPNIGFQASERSMRAARNRDIDLSTKSWNEWKPENQTFLFAGEGIPESEDQQIPPIASADVTPAAGNTSAITVLREGILIIFPHFGKFKEKS